MKKILLLLLITFQYKSYAYTINRSGVGQELYWKDNNQSFYLNPSNSSSISDSSINSIVLNSVNEYGIEKFKFSVFNSNQSNVNNQNNVYFSKSSDLFGGTSILAVTQVAFDLNTGAIKESDIIINDNIFFGQSEGSNNYLGDVITHELGHFIGLGHSETHGSSMFYSLQNGQFSLHPDDSSAIKHIYQGTQESGEIRGKIVGGNGIGIFGAHIQAISSISGRVEASAVSDEDGSFNILGLSKSATYFLYIKPIVNLDNLPTYYSSVKSNFCYSNSKYRGDFFGSCKKSERGYPLGIHIPNSGLKEVGNVSIGCDLKVSSDYMINKETTSNKYNIVDINGNVGEVSVGYFSNTHSSIPTVEDSYEVDLRDYNIESNNVYLDIKLVYQQLFSPIRITLTSDESILLDKPHDFYGLTYDKDGRPDLDIIGRIKLNTTASQNIFSFQVRPEKLEDFVIGKPFSKKDFLIEEAYSDPMNFYLMILTLSKKENGKFVQISEKKFRTSDNSSCIEGPLAFSVKNGTSTNASTLNKRKNSENSALSCATVNLNNEPPNSGPGPFLFSLISGFLLLNLAGAGLYDQKKD